MNNTQFTECVRFSDVESSVNVLHHGGHRIFLDDPKKMIVYFAHPHGDQNWRHFFGARFKTTGQVETVSDIKDARVFDDYKQAADEIIQYYHTQGHFPAYFQICSTCPCDPDGNFAKKVNTLFG